LNAWAICDAPVAGLELDKIMPVEIMRGEMSV